MLTANIQPVTVVNATATQLGAYIINYDLLSQNCLTYWCLLDQSGNNIWNSNFRVPPEVLADWGSNDLVILQSIADANGFVIIP